MAYDPNDAADKKIVKDLVDAALAEQAEEHEQDLSGLKTKNKELLGKLKEAQKGSPDAEEVSRLETALEKSQGELKEAQKLARQTARDLEANKVSLGEAEVTVKTLLVDNGLTDALTAAKVPPEFLNGAKALLSSKVELKKTTEGKTAAMVGDKSLGDFVTEWSQGDEGKHYVAAPSNSGTGAPGNLGNKPASGKTITRAAYEANPQGHAAHFAAGGTIAD